MAGTSTTARTRKATPKAAATESSTAAAVDSTPAPPDAGSSTTAAAEATTEDHDSAAGTDTTTAAAPDSVPAPPDAAPLEPPLTIEPPDAPNEPAYATPTEVIPDDANLSEVIIDDATKEPPADVDGVFVPLTPYGSTFRCTVRLVERTFLGPHRNPVHRLLQPAGAQVSEGVAARIRERLEAQAARIASDSTEK